MDGLKTKVDKNHIQNIHDKTVWILENVGIDFNHQKALEIFKSKGAKVQGQRVFIDEKLLKEGLSTTVNQFTLKGSNRQVIFGTGKSVIASSSKAVCILKENQPSDPTIDDFIAIQKLNETSQVVDIVNSPAIMIKQIDKKNAAKIQTALTLKHTTKPIVGFCYTGDEAQDALEIAKAFYDTDKDYYIMGVGNMISPLMYPKDLVDAMMVYAQYRQPLCLSACSTPGITSPVTLAGTLVQNNAEILAGIVLMQLISPGTPLIYGNISFGCDMRYGSPAIGSIETNKMISYIKELASYYDLPCRAGGSLTDAKEIDWQGGVESAMSLWTTLHNGIDFVFHGCGEMDSLNVLSMEKFVLDEVLIESIQRSLDQKIVYDSAIDLETIKRVGPGGDYAYEIQTSAQYREEHFIPDLYNRELYVHWKINGSQSIIDNAKKVVQHRIETYRLPNLDKRQKGIIEKILSNL